MIDAWLVVAIGIAATVIGRMAWLVAEATPSARFQEPIRLQDGTITDIGWKPFERITYCPWQRSSFGGDVCAHCGQRQDTWRHRRYAKAVGNLGADR